MEARIIDFTKKLLGFVFIPTIFLLLYHPNLNAQSEFSTSSQHDCSSIDLRSTIKFPVRNQKDIAWCYAYSAADMISQYYGLEKVSASDIAINYNDVWIPSTMKFIVNLYTYIFTKSPRYKNGEEFETGFIKIAINNILKKGVCLESDMPDNYIEKVDKVSGAISKINFKKGMKEILELHKKYEMNDINPSGLSYFYKMGDMTEDDFWSIFQSKSSQVISLMNKRACEGKRIQVPSIPKVRFKFFKGRSSFDIIHQVLEDGKPVAIDYSVWVYKHNKKISLKERADLHTSNIFGRRFNPKTNACEFLVRNSYGDSCRVYHSDYECEHGYYWIPEKRLGQGLLSYTFFD